MRKIALLTGVAGALMIAAPAFAQEATSPAHTPMPGQPAHTAPARTQTPAATDPATPPAPQSLTLQPGATVRGEGGVELGKLEGAITNAAGEQELTVRGSDGKVRAVPLGGLQVTGDGVDVAFSLQAYTAAPEVAAPAPATPPAPTPATPSTATPEAVDPATAPSLPQEPTSPEATQDPMTPDESAAPEPGDSPGA